MKIGILYICTGKYSVFWESFYKSTEIFFLANHQKKYFVFTDNQEIKSTDTVVVRKEAPKGFPMDSLLRFEMFLSIKEQLLEMDYLFFFNSNMQIVKAIGNEILPLDNFAGLTALLHPGYYTSDCRNFPYERNKRSTAYIEYSATSKFSYYMGSLNGGKTKDYLKLIQACRDNVQTDLQNGIIAIYHDESHLNQYLNGKDILQLSPDYGYPEDSNLPFDARIIILNKVKHGGKYFDKLPQKSYVLRFFLKLKRIYSSFIWKFQ